jgi:hypothetical protein
MQGSAMVGPQVLTEGNTLTMDTKTKAVAAPSTWPGRPPA